MTITLNTDYDVTLNTALLGYVGETQARPVSIEGMEIDGADRYVLTIDYGDGVAYEVDITGGQWTPTADILRSAQTVSCQICAKKLSGDEYVLVKKSRIFRLRIGAAIGDNAVPSPSVAVDALDRIDAIGRQAHADMQTAVSAAKTATTAAENAEKSATSAGVSADTATQAAERAETAQTSAETSATQAETAKQGAETARQQAVMNANAAKISADQAASAAQQTTADRTATATYAQTAKTAADSTAADRQAVQDMSAQVTADKATIAENTAKVAEDRTAAENAAQTAQAVADSLPDDYTTAVGKIVENTADIADVRLTDKELKRRVDALYDIGQGITHQFETDSDTAYAKTVPTGAKLMSVKRVGGRSLVRNQMCSDFTYGGTKFNCKPMCSAHKYLCRIDCDAEQSTTVYMYFREISYTKNNQTSEVVKAGKSTLSWITSPYGDSDIGGIFDAFLLDSSVKVTFSNRQIFDLTTMFGAGNEPASVEEFEKIFPADYYPYCAGEIISAGTEEVVEQGVNLYYGMDMLKVGSDDYEYIANSYRCKAIKLKPNTTYTLSFTSDKTSEIILLMNVSTVVNAQPYLDFRKTSDNRSYRTGDNGCLYVGVYAGNGSVASADVVKRLSECEIMISEGDTTTAYTPYHRNEYAIPEAIRNLPGYGIEGNVVDYEAKTYTQNNTVDGTEIKALDTPIVTDISTLIDDDFLRNIEVEAGGSITFKNGNGDNYRIPVPSEEEYVVKLSEVGGTT